MGLRIPLIAGAVLLAMTGCSAKHDPVAAPVPASASAPSEPAYSTTPVISEPAIGSLHGISRGSAEAAVKTLIGYVREDSYAPRRMQPKSEYSAADFAGPGTHMTPELREWWREQVAAKYQAGSTGRVKVIALFNVQGTGNDAFATQGPSVVNERISKVTATSEDDRALKVELTYRADLRMIDSVQVGRPILFPVTKTVTYTMVPSKGTWLIDDYDGTFDFEPAPKPSPTPSA